jgi:hypothetical protein
VNEATNSFREGVWDRLGHHHGDIYCRDYPLGIWNWMAWIITASDVGTSGDVLCLACDPCLFCRRNLGIGASRYASEELNSHIINAR